MSGATAVALGIWFSITLPVAALLGLWGWRIVRRSRRRTGWALVSWAVALPFAPPLLTLLTWLVYGEEMPPQTAGSEPLFAYYGIVAIFSFGFALFATPFVALFAWAASTRDQ